MSSKEKKSTKSNSKSPSNTKEKQKKKSIADKSEKLTIEPSISSAQNIPPQTQLFNVCVVQGRKGQKDEDFYELQPNLKHQSKSTSPFQSHDDYYNRLNYQDKQQDYNHNNQIEQQQYYFSQNQQPYIQNNYEFQRTNKFQQNSQEQQYVEQLRKARMKDQISINLIPKLNKLQSQLQRIDNRLIDITTKAKNIEKETRDFFDDIISKLRDCVNNKFQLYNQQKNEIKKEIDEINESINQYQQLQEFSSLQAQNLFQTVERITYNNKSLNIEIYPDDLPCEINQLKSLNQIQLDNYKMKKLLEFKNEVIWKIHNECQLQSKQLRQDLEFQANEEISKWYELIEQYQMELNKYNLNCCYCGIKFDHQLINSDCNFNQNASEIEIKIFAKDLPSQEHYGTGRHFFTQQQNKT